MFLLLLIIISHSIQLAYLVLVKKVAIQKDNHEIHSMLKDDDEMNNAFLAECYNDANNSFYVHEDKESNLIKVLKLARTFRVYNDDYSESTVTMSSSEEDDCNDISYEEGLEGKTKALPIQKFKSTLRNSKVTSKVIQNEEDVSTAVSVVGVGLYTLFFTTSSIQWIVFALVIAHHILSLLWTDNDEEDEDTNIDNDSEDQALKKFKKK